MSSEAITWLWQADVLRFKATHLVVIGAHTRQDDEVLFTALEGVHRGHLNGAVQLLPQWAVSEHGLHTQCTRLGNACKAGNAVMADHCMHICSLPALP